MAAGARNDTLVKITDSSCTHSAWLFLICLINSGTERVLEEGSTDHGIIHPEPWDRE